MEELQIDYTSLQETVEQLLPRDFPVSVETFFKQLIAGDGVGTFFKEFFRWMFSNLSFPVEQGIYLLFLVMFAALFSNLSKAFLKNGASQMGFLCVYLLLALSVTGGFRASFVIAKEGLENICRFASVLFPTYCVSIAFVTGSLTAAGYYQGTTFLIVLLEYLTSFVLLPLSQMYLLLAFASCMQQEPVFSKLLTMIVNVFSWIQKTLLGVALAFGGVQGILLPAVDRVKKNALVKSASAIPGVGNLVNGAWETVMGAGIVLKNAIGIGGICLLFLICAFPLCQLGLQYLMYRLVGVATEPVLKEQTEEFLFHAGTAQKLLFQTLSLGMMLFLLLLVVMTRITV